MPNSKPILFADYRSLIITNPSPIDFKKRYHHCICSTKRMDYANSLFLNYEKTRYMHFMTKSSSFL